MRIRLGDPAKNGFGARQIKIGERYRFGSVEIDIDQVAGFLAEHHGDVAVAGEVLRQVGDGEVEIRPTFVKAALFPWLDRHDPPAAAQIIAGGTKYGLPDADAGHRRTPGSDGDVDNFVAVFAKNG